MSECVRQCVHMYVCESIDILRKRVSLSKYDFFCLANNAVLE